jgi:hypothetical protein
VSFEQFWHYTWLLSADEEGFREVVPTFHVEAFVVRKPPLTSHGRRTTMIHGNLSDQKDKRSERLTPAEKGERFANISVVVFRESWSSTDESVGRFAFNLTVSRLHCISVSV